MKSGIYKIVNSINNKFYIGSSMSFANRWRKHKYDLSMGKHHSIILQRAVDKYGIENFEFVIIERIIIKEECCTREQWFLDNEDCHYNVRKFVDLHSKGNRCHSEETKRKIGLANSKKRLGTKVSLQTREKTSVSAKLYCSQRSKEDLETLGKKISLAKRGKKASEETKSKLKEVHRLRILKLKTEGFKRIGNKWIKE